MQVYREGACKRFASDMGADSKAFRSKMLCACITVIVYTD